MPARNFQPLEKNAIAAIRVYRFDIPLCEDFAISGSRAGTANNVLIAIETNDGRTGWGEASPVQRVTGESQTTCLAAAKKIKRALIGRDAGRISSCIAAMNRAIAGNPTIKSAYDIALHDLVAQRAGLPLCEFLGGPAKKMPTDATIFLRPLHSVAERALELVGQGFKTLKVKLGGPSRDDVDRVRLVREAVGRRIGLRVDANQGWDRDYALKTLRAIAGFRIEFCEQPLRASDRAGLRWLGRRSPIPLMADESLFSPRNARSLATKPWAKFFNIKLSKSGGLHNAVAIARIAREERIPCMTGCMNESRLGLTAAAHFAAAMDPVRVYDLDSHLMHAADWIDGGLNIARGIVTLPRNNVGLGAKPTGVWLAKNKPVQ